MSIKASDILEIHLKEFEALKREQLHRLGVRDNVIYLNIAASATLISVLSTIGNGAPLLLVPWVGLLLGWTYLVNDEKVSAIGRYIRQDLEEKLKRFAPEEESTFFGWEISHRSDADRVARKQRQLVVDIVAFIVPGIVALLLYFSHFSSNVLIFVIAVGEVIALIVLGTKMVQYADIGTGK